MQDLDVHDPVHVEFWDAMVMVAEHELGEARRQARGTERSFISCPDMDLLPISNASIGSKWSLRESPHHIEVSAAILQQILGYLGRRVDRDSSISAR